VTQNTKRPSHLFHRGKLTATRPQYVEEQKRDFCLGIYVSPSRRFITSNIGSQGALLNEAAKLIDNKLLRTTVTEVVPKIDAKNLREVHRRIESGRTLGKIVLAGWS
jgi:NADPH:quinone reductase-like Zn-dependent oxidoreductase